jgi:Domain of unknown function (DUF397)
MGSLVWRKSTRSGGSGENCVELASASGIVAVRDPKDPDGPVLTFSRGVFARFAAKVKDDGSDVVTAS